MIAQTGEGFGVRSEGRGNGKGIEITKKGGLIAGEIIMGRGPTNPVPVDNRTVHIHDSLVDKEADHTRRSPFNIGTDHIHRNTQTEDQIPRRNVDPVMRPWML